MVGWLVDGFVGTLFAWSVSWLVGRLVSCLVGSVGWSDVARSELGRPSNVQANKNTHRPAK